MHTQRRYATCFKMSKKEKIKDAYPKKVCHMLRHVKREENKRCIPKEGMPHAQACQKKEKRKPLIQKERDGAYKGVHTPSTKNIHTLVHLDQGL